MKIGEIGKEEFTGFVLEHENDDPAKLLLSGGKWKGIDIGLAVNTIISRKKLKAKVPEWYAEPGLVFPVKLSAEQCSSSRTAEYKAALALRLFLELNPDAAAQDGTGRKMRIADLTGGLGVDSWAFSKVSEEVLYNEMNPLLAEAAVHNFRVLGAGNISVNCRELDSGSLEEILGGHDTVHGSGQAGTGEREGRRQAFRPDIIYLDPARRNQAGRKVFLMEDCSPDIAALEDPLLEASPAVIVKLSPMADLSMVMERLGDRCRELHIVSHGGECKELLAVLDRNFHGECTVVAANDAGAALSGQGVFSFRPAEERGASAHFPSGEEEIRSSPFLFEPGKSLMKSGAFNLISSRTGITKLSGNTHLYIFRDVDMAARLCAYGKVFRILDIFPMTGRGIREAGDKYPEAEVTARNIRMSSEQLRRKLGTRPDDRRHIFGAEFLFVAEKWNMEENDGRQ